MRAPTLLAFIGLTCTVSASASKAKDNCPIVKKIVTVLKQQAAATSFCEEFVFSNRPTVATVTVTVPSSLQLPASCTSAPPVRQAKRETFQQEMQLEERKAAAKKPNCFQAYSVKAQISSACSCLSVTEAPATATAVTTSGVSSNFWLKGNNEGGRYVRAGGEGIIGFNVPSDEPLANRRVFKLGTASHNIEASDFPDDLPEDFMPPPDVECALIVSGNDRQELEASVGDVVSTELSGGDAVGKGNPDSRIRYIVSCFVLQGTNRIRCRTNDGFEGGARGDLITGSIRPLENSRWYLPESANSENNTPGFVLNVEGAPAT